MTSLLQRLLRVFGLLIVAVFALSTVAHASGTGWSVAASPNPSTISNSLQSVAAISTTKVWAVGYSVQGTTKSNMVKRTLIEHYNGTTWQVVASPNVGTGDNVLTGVAVLTGNNVWAVGSSPTGALVLHFNGTRWSLVSAPLACQFNAVTAISASDMWAVGTLFPRTCAEHYNGTTWSLVPTPFMGTSGNTLLGVSASSSRNVWAVGTYCVGSGCDQGGGSFQTLIYHYNGSRWSVVPSPNPSYENQLNAVTVISATGAWAVGNATASSMTRSTLILHFDGISWVQVVSPSANDRTSLTGIAAASATDLYAVGSVETPTQASVIEHFDGTTWSIVSHPSPGMSNSLNAVAHVPGAALGTAQFWAVGNVSTPSSGLTLTERDM